MYRLKVQTDDRLTLPPSIRMAIDSIDAPTPPTPTFTIRDDFDGTAGSTTTWGDAVSTARYNEAFSGGYTISVVGGEELSVAYNGVGGQYVIGVGNGFDGDFEMTAKVRYTVNATFGEGYACGIQLAFNAVDGAQNTWIGLYGNGPATRELRSEGGSIAFAPTSFYLRIRREGINTWMEYSTDNVTYNELSTFTASLGSTFYLGLFGSYFGLEFTSFYDWIEIVTNEDIEA